ncbi:MAG: CHAP domain-containing protein [Candidatus Pacearchaeota archaeon]|jgi:hypothetical protein
MIDQFVLKWNNQYNNYDKNYGTQCKDLFSQYNKDIVGNPNYVWGDAWALYDNSPNQYYEKILNTPSFVPIKGDVCIWKQSFGGYGHVAICLDGCTTNKMRLLGQNYPKVSYQDSKGNWVNGSPCQIVEMSYSKVKGFLRPKGNMNTFTQDQARRLYQIIGRREPESEAVTQNRGWELVEGLANELDSYVNRLNTRISELTGQVNTMNGLIGGLNSQISNLTSDNKSLQDIITKNTEDILKLNTQINDAQEERKEMIENIKTITKTNINLETKIKELEKNNLKGLTFWEKIILLFS